MKTNSSVNVNEYANTNYSSLALLRMKMLRMKRKEGRKESKHPGIYSGPAEWRTAIATTNKSLLQCPPKQSQEEGAGVL